MDHIGAFVYHEFEPRLPPLVDGREVGRHRVVIAGGGPVGLCVALALARWGVASVVLEADTTVCTGSRAICISRRSLEIIEQLGALDAHLAKGLPWEGGRTYHGTDQILHFRMPDDENQKLPPMINLQQYWIEQFLVDAAARHPQLIEIRWGAELVGLEQHQGADGGVTLDVQCQGQTYSMQGDWLVACDGGQSFARKHLGLKMQGTAFEGKYVIADITLPSTYPTERRAWFDPPSNPGSTVLMHKQPDDLWRLDYQIPDDADMDEALKSDNVAAFVKRHLQMLGEAHLPWEIVWISAYRAGAMTISQYRHGRILFAGNAAHALPIFGVRGLNSGIDDAYNLGWKLAATLHGWAGTELLDSYDSERLHGFRANAASAIQSTEFMAPPSRGFSLMREAALTLAHRHAGIAQLANPRQTSVITYDDSPLNAPSDLLTAGPVPGAALLECPLDGPPGIGHLTDLMGPHWTALVFTPDGVLDAALDRSLRRLEAGPLPFCTAVIAADAERAVHDRRVIVNDHARRAARMYGIQDHGVYLVRPDGHVAGRWKLPTPQQLAGALGRAAIVAQHDTQGADRADA